MLTGLLTTLNTDLDLKSSYQVAAYSLSKNEYTKKEGQCRLMLISLGRFWECIFHCYSSALWICTPRWDFYLRCSLGWFPCKLPLSCLQYLQRCPLSRLQSPMKETAMRINSEA